MTFLFTSDLHGKPAHYQEINEIVKRNGIDVVILGGDLLPRRGHGKNSLQLQRDYICCELTAFFESIKNMGASVYATFGNDDWAAIRSQFQELEERNLIQILSLQPQQLTDDIFLLGYPYVPPTPFSPKDWEKRDCENDPPHSPAQTPISSLSGAVQTIDQEAFFSSRHSIEEELRDVNLNKADRTIFVSHAPPHDTALDRLANGEPIGSRAIRDFILRSQPAMTLHGHIHESPDVSGRCVDRLGRTISVNPGQTYSHLSAVIFNFNDLPDSLVHTRFGSIGKRL